MRDRRSQQASIAQGSLTVDQISWGESDRRGESDRHPIKFCKGNSKSLEQENTTDQMQPNYSLASPSKSQHRNCTTKKVKIKY